MSNNSGNRILTPNEVADLLMVSPATVRQWAAKGQIKALTTPGGHRRFRMTDIRLFAEQRGISLNIEPENFMNILIVDDDIQFSGYLAELVPTIDERISVKVANDGFEAGKLVHLFNPNLILLDLMMPTLDGFETCRSIKADPQTSNIRIIAMTGYGSEENVERILKLGADVCLAKPIDEAELEKYIKLFLV